MSLLEPESKRKLISFIPGLAEQIALARLEYELLSDLYKRGRRKSFRRWMKKLKRLEREGRNAA